MLRYLTRILAAEQREARRRREAQRGEGELVGALVLPRLVAPLGQQRADLVEEVDDGGGVAGGVEAIVPSADIWTEAISTGGGMASSSSRRQLLVTASRRSTYHK